jgi:hypothetical protein
MNGYLTKPLELEKLRELIAEWSGSSLRNLTTGIGREGCSTEESEKAGLRPDRVHLVCL